MKTHSTRSRSRRASQQVANETRKKVTPQNVQTNSSSRRRKPGKVEEPSTDFGKTLQSLLGKKQSDQKVSEEEIYAALILHQLKAKGDQYTSDWKSTYKLNEFDKPAKEKVASAERAADDSMKFFVESTLLTQDEAKAIKQTAFGIAQLDDKTNKLWDHFGGDKENTIAVTSFSNAQKLIQERLDAQTTSSTQTKTMKVLGKTVQVKKFSAVG
jgi:hypothetical protein